jgi:hypothetical protein
MEYLFYHLGTGAELRNIFLASNDTVTVRQAPAHALRSRAELLLVLGRSFDPDLPLVLQLLRFQTLASGGRGR